jgi:excisionase family DNA binding protein
MTGLPDKELLRPDEVAKYLSVTRKTVYLWVDSGILEAVRVCKLLRIRRTEVEKLLIPTNCD